MAAGKNIRRIRRRSGVKRRVKRRNVICVKYNKICDNREHMDVNNLFNKTSYMDTAALDGNIAHFMKNK